jgi:hypothetical protein
MVEVDGGFHMEHRDEQPSSAQLVRAVERLDPAELERFADEVASIRARRRAPLLSVQESALFEIINRALADDDRARLEFLSDRRRQEALTAEEHRELLDLHDRLERLHAARMEALAQLACSRGMTLPAVMDQLGIRFPDHA